MPRVRTRLVVLAVMLLLIVAAWQVRARTQSVSPVTSPQQQFGARVGDDYFLATYSQLVDYWKTLARESDRLKLVDIGRTEEGRTQWMAVVSAPENLAQLDRYRDISRRLALAEGITEQQARSLAASGKAIVWIDGGIHANETLGAQQLIELVYQLVSSSDPETLRILHDDIVLIANANPDGQELVSKWYMREKDPRRRSLEGLPRLYQKYVGHDNNRDFYMSTQAETININRVLYREWFPQIVYDHHQSGPPGTVMFAPPFRDPFNYVYDPLIPVEIDLIGAAMHSRFAAERKPGVTMRTGSSYSTWWNGGLRTTAYFHNQIGLLTETIGDPAPMVIPFVRDKQLPTADLPFPIAPQQWHFRQSIDYEMTANRAVLDAASRYREVLLFNAWRMGKNAIDRGNTDTWTASPHHPALTEAALHDPARRDPRGYILPSDQPDFLTATKFVDALLKNGIAVQRATEPFTIGTTRYPAGSFVVRTAQAFRPHVLDMFEPQDHPDDIPYPGASPRAPYDNTGWTLAFQMGIKFDRILDAFEGPFVPVTDVKPPAGDITGVANPRGYLVSHHQNDAFVAVNRLLAAGEDVYWLRDRSIGGAPDGTGMMYIAAKRSTRSILQGAAHDLGLRFIGVDLSPPTAALKLRPVRLGLVDLPGGAVSAGWMRWLLERYEFPFEVVEESTLRGADIGHRFDVLLLSHDVGVSRSAMPSVKQFVDAGGAVIAIGDATDIGPYLGVPVTDALTTTDASGRERPLAPDEFYIPGSILRASVDNTSPLGYGFERQVDVFFDSSPAWKLAGGPEKSRATRIAWYASSTPLRSGWAWGQDHLNGALAVVDAPVGRGRVMLFGPQITYRAQPHGTFKFLFNAILSAKATSPGDASTAAAAPRRSAVPVLASARR